MEINELPDEVLGLIFEYLDLRTRAACELTCQRWNIVMWSVPLPPIRLWSNDEQESHNLHNYPQLVTEVGELANHQGDQCKVNSALLESFLKKHKRAKVLFLRLDEKPTSHLELPTLTKCLNTIEREWLNLRTLQLDVDCLFKETVLFISKLRIARYITRIQVKHDDFDDISSKLKQFYASCTNLEILHVVGRCGGDHLRHLTALPHLKSLFISSSTRCSIFTTKYVPWITANLSNLQELKVNSINEHALTMICNMPNLVTFGFNFHCDKSSSKLSALAQLKNLRNLSVACSEKNIEVPLLEALSNCTNLRALSLNMDMSEILVTSLPSCVPKLEVLDLFGSSDEHFDHAMKRLPQLSQMAYLNTLYIPFCPFAPLIEFIKRSSSIRNIDACHYYQDWHSLRLFHTMNRKAKAEKNEQFAVRVRIERKLLKNVAPNLKLYCLN